MPTLEDALRAIARDRKKDPLAPVTVVVPSHVAGIQARRRLAEHGPFAGVRFETLPRLAELIGAPVVAAAGRSPLARPIGDYAAALVAREAGVGAQEVRELPGFGRALRQTFRRMRRGGISRGDEVSVPLGSGISGEVMRLLGDFRARTAAFYDDDDLLEAAANALDAGNSAIDLGAVYVVPPGALTAGSDRFLRSLRKAAASYSLLSESSTTPATRFVLAPDPASEAREVSREVVRALGEGVAIGDIAVFHGADRAYRSLLSQAMARANVPVASMPGTPLTETPAGRGVLLLASLPGEDYARTAVLDFLALAPLKERLPTEVIKPPSEEELMAQLGRPLTMRERRELGTPKSDEVVAVPAAWRRIAREAGVSHGQERWRETLSILIEDYDATINDQGEEVSQGRKRYAASEREHAVTLRDFIAGLVQRLEPLRAPQPAASFIRAFRDVVLQYIPRDTSCMDEVLGEVDQLGTVEALGGMLGLDGFAVALRANLDLRHKREQALGEGVLIADYRLAAGLRFRHAILCGAYEGVFPASSDNDALVEDAMWTSLRKSHPYIEDSALKLERARDAARRAIAAATESIIWTAPLQAANAGRDYYPSSFMVAAAKVHDETIASATDLRLHGESDWLRRVASPLAGMLRDEPTDVGEISLRWSLQERKDGVEMTPNHPLGHNVHLLQSRRSETFSEYDGNLSIVPSELLIPSGTVSPTSLQAYAECGMRYFLASVLRLRSADEPEERELMDGAERGSLVHAVLERFFLHMQALGRPQRYEQWTAADRDLLLGMLEEELKKTERRGRAGLAVFADHQRRGLRADLSTFLEADNDYRMETGAVPVAFEKPIPETEVGGFKLRGYVDRIDQDESGKAWVVDYKTGSSEPYAKITDDDPFAGGKALQLPVYLSAVPDAPEVEAAYWFISRRGGFERLHYHATLPNQQRYKQTLAAVLEGLQAGSFPASPGQFDEFYNVFENCRYCDFDRLCSRHRDQESVEKAEDAAYLPWRRIAGVAKGEPE
jgi:ATP-dependent helicase/nuclease subunit B